MLGTYLGGRVCWRYGYLVTPRVDPGHMSGLGRDIGNFYKQIIEVMSFRKQLSGNMKRKKQGKG